MDKNKASEFSAEKNKTPVANTVAQYEAIIEAFDGLIYICSKDYRIKFMNKKFIDRTGYDGTGDYCYKALHNLDDICPWCINDRVFKGEKVKWEVFSPKDKRWYQIINTPVYYTGDNTAKMSIIHDITEQKETEKKLAEEKERLAVTLQSIEDGVITTDIEGNILLINSAGEKLTGWTQKEAKGKKLNEVFKINNKTEEAPADIIIKQKCHQKLSEDTVITDKKGIKRNIYAKITPLIDKNSKITGAVIVFRDTTIEKKLEEESLKSSKFESLSTLAGGIAHDFNNNLTAILGNITLTKMYSNENNEAYHLLLEAEKAAYKAKNLTGQLLTLSKGEVPEKKVYAIGQLLKDAAHFSLCGSTIDCKFSIPPDLWSVEVDQDQITQVINNIIINAIQSMPRGGIIEIGAKNFFSKKQNELPLKNGKYVKISISDEGTGIKKDYFSKIFDPYFTTKEEGSGLGLSTTYSIIKKHNGHITVESIINKGTTFYIYLPAFEEKKNKKSPEKPLKGEGKILLMDDEEIILKTTGKILKRLGYIVEFAKNGEEVIKACKDDIFDVAILDLTVPGGMGGQETIEKLIKDKKAVRAIASSGYPDHPVMVDFKKYGFSAAIAKPYKISELSKILQKII